MHTRPIAQFTGSLMLLQLLHHAQALAQTGASSSNEVAPNTVPSQTEVAPSNTPAPPAPTASTGAASAPPISGPATASTEPMPQNVAPPTGVQPTSAPPTAQFEAVTSPPVAAGATQGATPARADSGAGTPFALGTTPSGGASTVAAPTALPKEQSAQPTEVRLAFEDSRAAINAAGPFEPSEFRQHEVPGDYVARPVTLPEGTFELTLNNYLAFVDAAESVGWVPSFALGITPSFELGVSAPLRYNESLRDWTKLDPIVHLAQQWLDDPEIEAAVRFAALIPLTSRSEVQFELGVPFLWHASSAWRVDAAVNAVVALEDSTQAALNVPLGVTLQATSWLYASLLATPNVGLTEQRSVGVDAGARLGLTLQTRGSAQVDLVATMFAENIGTGRAGQTTDGIGTVFTAAFFPEIY